MSLTESTAVHSVANSFIGAAQGPIPQDISWKYAGAVQVGGNPSLFTRFRSYLAHFPPVFFPFCARFHRLNEAVPTSPKPEPRAKKHPASDSGMCGVMAWATPGVMSAATFSQQCS